MEKSGKATLTVKILNMIKLVLPILFPSWRFFSGIGVSPRFDVGFVSHEGDFPSEWIPFRPLPKTLSFTQNLKRLVYNPAWNELLFLNSCAERLFDGGGEFYHQEIARHLLSAVQSGEISVPDGSCFMRFRIRAIYSEDASASHMGQIKEDVVVQSDCYVLPTQRSRT